MFKKNEIKKINAHKNFPNHSKSYLYHKINKLENLIDFLVEEHNLDTEEIEYFISRGKEKLIERRERVEEINKSMPKKTIKQARKEIKNIRKNIVEVRTRREEKYKDNPELLKRGESMIMFIERSADMLQEAINNSKDGIHIRYTDRHVTFGPAANRLGLV